MPARSRSLALVLVVVLVGLSTSSCGGGSDLIVGATTSIQDTGLLDVLTEAFREERGYDVAAVTPIIAGSGQILELARRGEIDAVITHSPDAEAQLIADGDGVDRREIMHNLFVLVGPPAKNLVFLDDLVLLRVDDHHPVFALDGDIQKLLRVRCGNAMGQFTHFQRPYDFLRGYVDNA